MITGGTGSFGNTVLKHFLWIDMKQSVREIAKNANEYVKVYQQ